MKWICLSLLFLSFTYQEKEGLHVLELEPQDRIELYQSASWLVGVEKVETVIKKTGAEAALNGGFFLGTPQLGSPAGILKIAGTLLSTPIKARCAFGFTGTTYLIDRIDYQASLVIDNISYPLDGINTRKNDTQAVLYTPHFFKTTLTSFGGTEYLINPQGAIIPSAGGFNALIPSDGLVYSLGKNLPLSLPATYTTLHLDISLLPLQHPENYILWNNFENILGGTPLLIMDGKINPDFNGEKVLKSFIFKEHSRSALGIKKDGTLFFVVTTEEKLPLQELAERLLKLGAEQAMNLDGGSSSLLYVNGSTVNRPISRPVGNFILINVPIS